MCKARAMGTVSYASLLSGISSYPCVVGESPAAFLEVTDQVIVHCEDYYSHNFSEEHFGSLRTLNRP